MKTIGLFVSSILMLSTIGCVRKGCMDPSAVNFNSDANREDGSCTYNTDYTIKIDDPIPNGIYQIGDTVYLNIEISTSFPTHGFEALMINKTLQDTVLVLNDHAHDLDHSLHGFWFNNVSVDSQMEVQIKLFQNHFGTGIIEEKAHFTCLSN